MALANQVVRNATVAREGNIVLVETPLCHYAAFYLPGPTRAVQAMLNLRNATQGLPSREWPRVIFYASGPGEEAALMGLMAVVYSALDPRKIKASFDLLCLMDQLERFGVPDLDLTVDATGGATLTGDTMEAHLDELEDNLGDDEGDEDDQDEWDLLGGSQC